MLPAVHVHDTDIVTALLEVAEDGFRGCRLPHTRGAMDEHVPACPLLEQRPDALREVPLLRLPERQDLRQELILESKLVLDEALAALQDIVEETHQRG